MAGSISTKSTLAPQYNAQLADARKLLGLVHTREPGPTPSARQARCKATVALLTATAWATPWQAAKAASKRGTCVPWVRKSERSTSVTARMSSSLTDWRL